MIGKNFIFIEPPKNGTTSIRSILEPYTDPCFEGVRGDSLFHEGGEIDRHAPAWVLKNFLNNYLWDNTFKFAVIRNPYERFYSEYIYSIKTSGVWKKGRVEGGELDPHRLECIELSKSVKNFEEYVDCVYEQMMQARLRSRGTPERSFSVFTGRFTHPGAFPFSHISQKTQFTMLCSPYGGLLVDYVCKLENIDEGMKVVTKKLGLPNLKIPKKNTTKEVSLLEHYTGSMIKKVNEIFEDDFSFLPYEKR